MSRTTAGQVTKLLGPNYDGASDVQQFIDMATITTSDALAEAAKRRSPYDSARAELIERNLAAYYYCIMDPLFMSKSTGGASGSWQARSYLDAAKALDPVGVVAFIVAGKRVGAAWLGKQCRQ